MQISKAYAGILCTCKQIVYIEDYSEHVTIACAIPLYMLILAYVNKYAQMRFLCTDKQAYVGFLWTYKQSIYSKNCVHRGLF